MTTRCEWAKTDHAPMLAYHDDEWGVPEHDDQRLFEFLCLEGAQAGLAWRTILDKRARFRQRFHAFDIDRVAAMDDDELAVCLTDPGIVRNRGKVTAMRNNARVTQDVIRSEGSLNAYVWSFVDDMTVVNYWQTHDDMPAATPVSEQMSRDMKKRGFRFVGPTICYAFMQATGMVNDHLVSCFRHAELADT